MKRFFPIIICIMLTASLLLSGCSNGFKKLSIIDSVDANIELLTEAMEEDATFKNFKNTVKTWAEENNINVVKSAGTYLVIDKDPATASSAQESFTFHCSIDLSSAEKTEESIEAATTVMTTIYSAENYKTVTGIFTLFKDGQAVGAEKLDSKYLDTDNFIDFTPTGSETIYDALAADAQVNAVKTLNYTAPTYTEAYKIELRGVSNQSPYKSRGTYPNPVKTIGDLLASCQSSSVLFELVEFNGGSAIDLMPECASATIVLHENDVESFTKKFDNSYKKVDEAYEDIDDETITFEYTMTPVETPEQVISKEDTENISSIMYTMISGNYTKDEETDIVMGVSSIGTVSTADGKFIMGVNTKALTDELSQEMITTIETICGLCDMEAEVISTTPVWSNDPENPMTLTLTDELKATYQGTLESKAARVFVDKKPDLNLIICGTSDKIDKVVSKILEYIPLAGVNLEK